MEFETSDRIQERRNNYLRKKNNILHLLVMLGVALYTLGGGTVYGYLAYLGVMVFFLREDISFREAVSLRRKMTVPVFLMLLVLSFDMLFLGIISDAVCNPILENFGLKSLAIKELIEDTDPDVARYSVTQMFMAGLAAPIFEELICRGYLMEAYRQSSGSKIYAILFSSIIFSSMHIDIVSFVPFFSGALVLAYTAMEYGIIWSALLHGMINFFGGYVFTRRIVMQLPLEIRFSVFFTFSFLIAVISVVILIVKRRSIAEYIDENECEREHVKLTLTSPTFILFITAMFILSLMRLNRV